MTESEIRQTILRQVAKALREAYTPPYYSMGGPRDGDSSPGEFDANRAADELERLAGEMK